MHKTPMTFFLGLSLILCFFLCSCSRPYWQNRKRDAWDCITLTSGIGVGLGVMAGPVNTGLLFNADMHGWRCGVPIHGMNNYSPDANTSGCFTVNSLLYPSDETSRTRFGTNTLPSRTADYWPDNKDYVPWVRRNRASFDNQIPVFARMHLDPSDDPAFHARQYYTQCEVVFGLGPSFRLGINPGEFLDLAAGFFGIDIYGDDLYPYETLWKKKRAEKRESIKDKS